MALPTVVAWGATNLGGSPNNPNPSYPAGVQVGDLLIYFLAGRNSGIYSAPAGWTEHSASPVWNGSTGGTAGAVVHVFYKWAAGGESGATGTVWGGAGQEFVGRMVALRGVHPSSPFDGSSSNATTATSSPASLPAGTTVNNDCLVFIAISIGTATSPQPTAMTNGTLTNQTFVFSSITTASQDGTLSVQTGEMATAGSWGATTIPKNTNGGYAVIGISVRGGGAAAQPRFYASIVG